MVTIISNARPNQILGEDYRLPIGSYSLDFHNKIPLSMQDRLFVSLEFNLECTPLVERDERVDTITFHTVAGRNEPQDHLSLKVCFDLSDIDGGDSVSNEVLAAMRNWFQR